MSVDTFTRQEFEQALPTDESGDSLWDSLGLVSGEYVYAIPVTGTNKRIVIRSSIKGNEKSAGSGKDSIQLWVEYQITSNLNPYKGQWFALKNAKLDRWTTRVPGWQKRMTEKLHELYKLALEDSKMKKVTSGANDGGNENKNGNLPSPSLVPEGAQVPQGAGPTCAPGAVGSSLSSNHLQSPTAPPSFSLSEFQQARNAAWPTWESHERWRLAHWLARWSGTASRRSGVSLWRS